MIDAFNDPALEPEIKSLYANYNVENGVRTIDNTKQFPVGCLIKNSLRYGDITGDSKPELAIFAQNQYGAVNISFFSIEAKKIIFQYRAISNDAKINSRKELEDGETLSETYPLANKPDDPQYLSVIVEENTPKITAVGPAVIQFAKIYTADFDGDEKLDLITWRKLYSSRENQDSIEGFRKIQDQLIHYKLVDGEYKKQPTESSVVKGWLTAKNLTWKKGYPSKSECAGQEGQFIPEMHDPLLNDPDVLQ